MNRSTAALMTAAGVVIVLVLIVSPGAQEGEYTVDVTVITGEPPATVVVPTHAFTPTFSPTASVQATATATITSTYTSTLWFSTPTIEIATPTPESTICIVTARNGLLLRVTPWGSIIRTLPYRAELRVFGIYFDPEWYEVAEPDASAPEGMVAGWLCEIQ